MSIQTKIFGEIEVDESKVIYFTNGIVGLPDMKRFLLSHDEDEQAAAILWLQSLDEPAFAIPLMNPFEVVEEYNPMIEDELLAVLDGEKEEDLLVFATLTVPEDVEKMTVNLKAPIIINLETKKGCQVIVEDDLAIKYPVYDILKNKKEVEE